MRATMVTETLAALLTRELRCIQRELEKYPSEAQIWQTHPALPNTAGTLALHAAGNLLHFIGSVFGDTGYQRDRDAEFQRRDVPRAELLRALREAVDACDDSSHSQGRKLHWEPNLQSAIMEAPPNSHVQPS